jgi:hypothetical protein
MGRNLTLITLSLALAVTCFSGCRGRYLAPTGPMDQVQTNAVVHDPFPQEDIGPSDPAARPLGYQRPLPEPVRNRLVPDAMPWLGR